MNELKSGETCDLIGVLGIGSQIALGLIIVATMLGRVASSSQETPRKPKKTMASIHPGHFKAVHILYGGPHRQPPTIDRFLERKNRPLPAVVGLHQAISPQCSSMCQPV